MKPLFTKKNGTSQRVAAIEVKMPASYPSSNVTYGSGSVEDALNDLFGIPIKQFTIASNETITLSNVFCVMLRTSGVAGGIHIINMGWGSYSYALGGTSTGCTLSASGYNLTITNTNAYSVACVKLMNAV